MRILGDEQDNEFAESVNKGHRIDPRAQKIFICVITLLVVYVVSLITPTDMLNQVLHMTRETGYVFSWFVEDLQKNASGLIAALTGQATSQVSYASTMIRHVVIALAGAGLALCGAVYQGSFRNALAAPSTLGVMSGVQLGLMVFIVLFLDD
ncbi:MAG: iron ABC transporter permease [Coriobacteriales bacterium]|nr:iron ABC transporter permease [Coriobacteriales bacterium]